MSMTLDQLRDWHAKRVGWNAPGTMPERTDDFVIDAIRRTLARGSWWKIVGDDFKRSSDHPFPPTLDGADASFPAGFEWQRNAKLWVLFRKFAEFATASVNDTGDKIRDLYELSKLAWEQEAAR